MTNRPLSLLVATILAAPAVSASRPPPESTLSQRFDDVQADIDAVRLLVLKLKGKAKLTAEVKARLERTATELEALEADTRHPKTCPPSTPCPVCPPVAPCPPPVQCPPSAPCPPPRPCPPAPEANQQPPKPEVMALINGASNLCLGVKGGHQHRAGAGIELVPCLGERGERPLDHQWTVVPAAPGFEFIRNEASGLCLGVRGVDQAGMMSEAEVFDCNAAGQDQRLDNQWKITNTGRGAMQLKNRVSGLCLSVQGGDRHGIGAIALLDRCDGPRDGRDSQWEAVPFAALMPSLVVRSVPVAPAPPPKIEPISDAELTKILRTVSAQSFAAEKMRVLKMALEGKPVTVAQVRTVIGQFSFAAEQLDAIRLLNPTIVDKDNRYQLFEAFTFDSDKATLEGILK